MPSNHSSERERDTSLGTGDYSGRSTPDTRDRSGSGTSGDGRSAGSGGGSSGTGGNDRSAGPGGGGNTGTGGNDRGGNSPGGGGNDRGGTSGGDRSFGDTRSFDGGSTVDRGSQQTGGFNAADRGTQSQGNGGFATALGDRTPTGFAPTGTTARPGDMNMPMSGARPGFAVAATPTGYAPSMRQAEIESMRAMSAYNNSVAPTHRATEEASMATLAFQNIVDRIQYIESADNPNAKNTKSTAAGLGQFIDRTWMATVREFRPDLLQNRTRQEVLDLKFDPKIAREMLERFTEKNIGALTKAGIEVTPSTTYAAHFLGTGGAIAAYSAARSTPAVDVLGKDAVKANPSVMSGRTIGYVRDWIDAKMAKAETYGYSPVSGAARQSAPSATAVGPRGGNTALPVDRPVMGPAGGANALPGERPSFADRYLNGDRPAPIDPNYQAPTMPAGDMNRTGWAAPVGDDGVREMDRSASRQSSRAGVDISRANDNRTIERNAGTPAGRPDNFNYRGPSGLGGPGGINLGSRQTEAAPAPAAPTPASPSPVAPSRQASVTPEARPASPVQEAAPQRSIGQRVAAGAIDIGAGMIPGIGPAIGIGNGIAAAIGARTLGERLVDGAGENTYQPGQVPDREGGNGDDSPYWFRNAETDADAPSSEVATPDDPVMTFTRRYLDPSRPTPGQKWGRPNQYGGVDLVG